MRKIISGGQAGADRAALDFAIEAGLEHGDWCPRGRKTEDGPLPAKYQLAETESANYRARTVRNVVNSDATQILNIGEVAGGSLETLRIAARCGKPVRVVQLDSALSDRDVAGLQDWLQSARAQTLNIAGPRESKRPGTYDAALALLRRLFEPYGSAG